ncbi:MAG: diguanylate phosphodiesterase [Betaproteobacteria bacterium HGW-Betaproteobacteria-18]|nr:MAG: diguanylate phosphodiesterase [Betaproteobacteria bacterium HGW-Betaproteobacteria-18]
MARSLRFWLSLSFSAFVAMAMALVVAALLWVLIPRLNAEVEVRNRSLGNTVAGQVESFLADAQNVFENLAKDMAGQPPLPRDRMHLMLDTVANTDVHLEAVYLIDATDHVLEVGLPHERRGQREDLVDTDLSGRAFVQSARKSGHNVWSDTYLSQRGRIVVALAVPFTLPDRSGAVSSGMLVGEYGLEQISNLVQRIGQAGDVLPIIVDRSGQIVGHPDAGHSLRQENISHLPLLQGSGLTTPQTARFRFGEIDYIGSTTPISAQGWTVLVAQPLEKAYATVRSTLLAVAAASLLALTLALISAFWMSRRMSRRVADFGRHMQAIADGDYRAVIPRSGTDEIEALAQSMRRMAEAVLQREDRLQLAATVFESTAEGILITDAQRRIISVNPALVSITGYSADELVGQKPSVFSSATHGEDFYRSMWASIESTGFWRGEIWNRRKNGEIFPELLAITAVRDKHGAMTHYVGSFFDISERKRAEDELAQGKALFEAIFSSIPDAIVYANVKREVVSINPAFSSIFGFNIDDLTGKLTSFFYESEEEFERQGRIRFNLTATELTLPYIVNYRKKDGEIFPGETLGTSIRTASGTLLGHIGVIRDITERKAAQEQIQSLAFSDPLTELPNRRLLLDRLEQALTAVARHQREGALLFIDVDNFKTINDTLGHDQGDLLLKQVAQRLLSCVREGDTVARVGGDEFVVLLKDLSQNAQEAATQAEAVAKKIIATLNHPYQIGSSAQRSTASIGVTLFGGDQREGIDEPLRRADMAMYQAKAAGRNTLRFFDPQMQAVVTARADLEAGLHEALEKNQFLLHYQAQVTQQRQIIGVEALVRWNDPRRGIVPPAEFIQLAEETGLILPLGKWVLETACTQLARWATQPETAHLTMAVNVSARQFHQSDFVAQVLATLARTGANGNRLKLELTESLLVRNVEDVKAKMNALKSKGVGFALDDFGTGYSSLSYLKRLPLDQLKIDQGFVRDILIDPNDAAIAKMVIALADSMGLAVIAEGVETEAQRDFLDGLGCHAFQGYLFSPPLPLEEFKLFFSAGLTPW